MFVLFFFNPNLERAFTSTIFSSFISIIIISLELKFRLIKKVKKGEVSKKQFYQKCVQTIYRGDKDRANGRSFSLVVCSRNFIYVFSKEYDPVI